MPADGAEFRARLTPYAARVLHTFQCQESKRVFHPQEPIQKRKLTIKPALNYTLPPSGINYVHYEDSSTRHMIQNYNSDPNSQNRFALPDIPRVEDLHNTTIDFNRPIHNFEDFENKADRIVQPSSFTTIEKILWPSSHNKINKDIPTNIHKVANVSENQIHWDNMFDSEALFRSEYNHDINRTASEVIKQTVDTSKLSTPKQGQNTSKNQIDSRLKKKQSPITIEITSKPATTTNYKQKKITELVPKKIKKFPESNDKKVDTKCVRKQPYTKVVKDWLANVDPRNTVECQKYMSVDALEVDTDLTKAIDIVGTSKKNTSTNGTKKIQSQLANKGGVLKYSTKKPKTVQNAQKINEDVMQTEQIDENSPIINNSKQNHNFSKLNINNAKLMGQEPSTIIAKEPIKNIVSTDTEQKLDHASSAVEKAKKKTSKFVVPIKSQLPVKDAVFNINNLNKSNIIEYLASLQNYMSITLTLVYRNGFCQLNRHFTEDDCIAEGIMIGTDNNIYYFLTKAAILESELVKTFLKHLLKITGNKLCYEAKDIIIFAAECLALHPNEISENFLDSKVACFLLDPDKPPQSFSEIQNMLNYTPQYTIATECNAQKTAWYMTLLDECMDRIQHVLTQSSLWRIFVGMEMKLLPILAGLEMHGLRVDVPGLNKMKEIILNKMNQVEQECYRSAGKRFQINSPAQLRAILYEDLQLDLKSNIKIKETLCLGAKSTSEAVLKGLAETHPLPKLILEYRHLHKALATFVNGIAQHVLNGVVRATWLQTAAVTGRIACNNPNLQAIPKIPFELNLQSCDEVQQVLHMRSVYLAREEQVLLAADFQHIECRVFAHLSGDSTLMDIFKQDGDFFRALAEKWLSKPSTEVTSEDRERTKRIVYASMYGAGPKKLMDILNISYDQTLTVISSFNRTFPSLKTFGQRVIERCQHSEGILETVCGRRRKFANIFSSNFSLRSQAERQAVNFMIQGSAADLCKAAMISTAESLRRLRPPVLCNLVLQIHDELVWEVAESDLPRVRDVVQEAMEGCGRTCGMDLTLPVAVSWGKNWSEMHS